MDVEKRYSCYGIRDTHGVEKRTTAFHEKSDSIHHIVDKKLTRASLFPHNNSSIVIPIEENIYRNFINKILQPIITPKHQGTSTTTMVCWWKYLEMEAKRMASGLPAEGKGNRMACVIGKRKALYKKRRKLRKKLKEDPFLQSLIASPLPTIKEENRATFL
eukprot:scaffold828_cov81-Cylindrotheca_fusiformis.AAC.1